ncbi:MAG: response regulator [Oscillospiraceae bacterium]|nr:response regulator [Oscillospiraceae bacterium]MBQ9208101.1 response regulator [Oscillospiraceae bacterium]
MKWVAVVDDDIANLNVAGQILSKNHIRVSAMKSGAALIKFIKENKPDLILLDIVMPQMDGFETLEKLRETERELGLPEVPVVFLTADEESETESRGFEMGVSDFIRKPFYPEVLLKRIENVIEKQEKINKFSEEASTDKLTGFLNKVSVNKR